MPSTNGYSPKRAVLYARVSTDEQARSGYSLAQQLEALREYVARQGYEILTEVTDLGQSGAASLERPGMDRVRDLVAAGGVSVVLAQDRGRFAREPAYHYLLRKEFEEHGCKIRALNDRGDDSAEGELADGILDQLSKYERAKTVERVRRGKQRKARQGKIVAGHRPHYGFKYNPAKDNYVVDDEEMHVVRRIFYMVGVEANSLRATRKALEAEGLPTPGGARNWAQIFVRSAILDDVYRPHTHEEVKALVALEVAARLDPDRDYDIFWHNTKRNTYKQVVGDDPGGKTYRKKRKTTLKPKEEWIPVPVPDSGVPRAWVDAARYAIKDNRRPPSAKRRFWELAGGLLRCGHCGGYMTTCSSLGRKPDGWYFYYRCARQSDNGTEACPHKKMYPAASTERRVWELVSTLLTDPEQLRVDLDAMIEEERKGMRGDPDQESKMWLDRLTEVDKERRGYQRLAAKGHMTDEELNDAQRELEETRKTAQRELKALRGRQERVEEMERDQDALLDNYARMAPEALDELTPEERHQVYRMLRLRAVITMDRELEISGAFREGVGFCPTEVRS
jgi:site-specific DNA recombinase